MQLEMKLIKCKECEAIIGIAETMPEQILCVDCGTAYARMLELTGMITRENFIRLFGATTMNELRKREMRANTWRYNTMRQINDILGEDELVGTLKKLDKSKDADLLYHLTSSGSGG